MELVRLPDAAAVASRAVETVLEVLRAEPRGALLLPAGATPVPVYAELVARAAAGERALDAAQLFQLDEVVGRGADDPRSFAAFLRAHLLDPLGPRRGGAHLLDGGGDPAATVAAHAAALERAGGAALAVLGLGRNGHVAFNEPGSLPTDGARVVELAAETRAAQGDGARLGLTLGLRELLAARRRLLLVTGETKADVLARLACDAPSAELPASWIAAAPRTTVLADEAACARLAPA